jgi:hypothetical protein
MQPQPAPPAASAACTIASANYFARRSDTKYRYRSPESFASRPSPPTSGGLSYRRSRRRRALPAGTEVVALESVLDQRLQVLMAEIGAAPERLDLDISSESDLSRHQLIHDHLPSSRCLAEAGSEQDAQRSTTDTPVSGDEQRDADRRLSAAEQVSVVLQGSLLFRVAQAPPADRVRRQERAGLARSSIRKSSIRRPPASSESSHSSRRKPRNRLLPCITDCFRIDLSTWTAQPRVSRDSSDHRDMLVDFRRRAREPSSRSRSCSRSAGCSPMRARKAGSSCSRTTPTSPATPSSGSGGARDGRSPRRPGDRRAPSRARRAEFIRPSASTRRVRRHQPRFQAAQARTTTP